MNLLKTVSKSYFFPNVTALIVGVLGGNLGIVGGAFMDRNGASLESSPPLSLLHEDSRRYLWPATYARELSQEPRPSAPSPVSVRDTTLCKKQTFLVLKSYSLWYPIMATSPDKDRLDNKDTQQVASRTYFKYSSTGNLHVKE